jgi:hypothetical protein
LVPTRAGAREWKVWPLGLNIDALNDLLHIKDENNLQKQRLWGVEPFYEDG